MGVLHRFPARGQHGRREKIGDQIRSWRLKRRSGSTLRDLARLTNLVVAGWIRAYLDSWAAGAVTRECHARLYEGRGEPGGEIPRLLTGTHKAGIWGLLSGCRAPARFSDSRRESGVA
jgi:hypothetical protein